MSRRLRLFEAIGVEIEYMIVDAESLDVNAVCDRLIEKMAGEPVSEFERGPIAWSNELVLHVLELKTNGPASTLEGLGALFHGEVRTALGALEAMGSTLLPGGVHPWMDPTTETRLWPHEYNEVYRTFDRIFGCSGHGWSNLQSTHINLPFGDDEEFGRLHAAIRATLAIIPALTAASPFLDGIEQPALDARLEAYRHNAKRVPQVSGQVIPEPVRSEQEYRDRILRPLYDALAPYDPGGVLRHEWVNARGAIARFERGAIEIRIVDAQERPTSDLAVVALLVGVVRALAEERWTSSRSLDAIETEALARIFAETVRDGGEARITDRRVLEVFGLPTSEAPAMTLWRSLADRLAPDMVPAEYGAAVETMVGHGSLAWRMRGAYRGGASLASVASELVECLAHDRMFLG
jgi:carboxylate-amine ligase